VSKGDDTRQAILGRAFELANIIGVSGLTIGRLAEDTGLSKSGLFAHFGSKEALEVAVVDEAGRQFVRDVLVPALAKPRGLPRLRALFDRWLAWGERPGGCFFVGASAELDDRPGPARDALVESCREWIDALSTAARLAVEQGHFRRDLDVDQFAFELYGLMIGGHTFMRFLKDRDGRDRTRAAFDRLVASAREPAGPSSRSR
jgi:AcrR family transcriptional regulator